MIYRLAATNRETGTRLRGPPAETDKGRGEGDAGRVPGARGAPSPNWSGLTWGRAAAENWGALR